MNRLYILLSLAAAPLSAFVLPEGPWEHHWAVIVAGSNGYGNYRHQADACHAYQIAKRKGIPERQIILFMYDDIAHSEENPIPHSSHAAAEHAEELEEDDVECYIKHCLGGYFAPNWAGPLLEFTL